MYIALISLNCCVQFFYLIFSFLIVSTRNESHFWRTYDSVTTADFIGDDIFFEILEPTQLEYTYRIRPAIDFGVPFNDTYKIKRGPLIPVVPETCCETPHNAEDLIGAVALIERGDCSFKKKTIVAEKAGARAVIITDMSETYREHLIEMGDDDTDDEAKIPAGYLMGQNGLVIRRVLNRLHRNYAIINLPINLTFTPLEDINMPPWLMWS